MKSLFNFKAHPYLILFWEALPYILFLVFAYLIFREAILSALRLPEPVKKFLLYSGGSAVTYTVGKKKAMSIYRRLFKK